MKRSVVITKVATRIQIARTRRELSNYGTKPRSANGAPASLDALASSTLAAQIHPNAGFGHQLSSWVSGALWAEDLGLTFVQSGPPGWEAGLLSQQWLPGRPDSRGRRLPAVPDERHSSREHLGHEVESILRRTGRARHFRLSLDQARFDQTPAAPLVRRAFLSGPIGAQIRSAESEDPYVAVHVRRGDVDASFSGASPVPRYVPAEWYESLIGRLQSSPDTRHMRVEVIVQARDAELEKALKRFDLTFRVGRPRARDLASMIGASVLVPAPSSFSFSAALASRGAVAARFPWWHHIPSSGRWVRFEQPGSLDLEQLGRAIVEANRSR